MTEQRSKESLLSAKSVRFASRDGFMDCTVAEWLRQLRRWYDILDAKPYKLVEQEIIYSENPLGGGSPISELRDREAFFVQLEFVKEHEPELLVNKEDPSDSFFGKDPPLAPLEERLEASRSYHRRNAIYHRRKRIS